MTPHHLPFYITKPGETDWLMIVMGIFLILVVLGIGNLYLKLHSLPERMAHKSQKLQFEIVAVLGLLALFTHIHLFWIAALLLALIDLPDFGTPLRSISESVERIADSSEQAEVGEVAQDKQDEKAAQVVTAAEKAEPGVPKQPHSPKQEVKSHA
jgi:hypothetical protein